MAADHADSPLHERLLAAIGDRTYRAIASETGHNPETVRRYMQGQAPSAEFLSRICECFDVNAHWLMTGAGPMRQSDSDAHVLRDATPGELLAAIADTLEKLLERVDRLEIFVQTLETRLRAAPNDDAHDTDDDERHGADTSEPQTDRQHDTGVKGRAQRVAAAAASKRSSPLAD